MTALPSESEISLRFLPSLLVMTAACPRDAAMRRMRRSSCSCCGELPPPTPEERIVIAVGAIVRPRCVGPPRVVKLLLGLHNGLQTRGDEVARLRRQGVLRAHQPERVVDLSGQSRAVSQTTERAEVLRGGPFVAEL